VVAQKDGSLMERLLFYSRLNLLIIDELGYMPVPREQANLLFQIISIRYERGSTVLTSDYVFDEGSIRVTSLQPVEKLPVNQADLRSWAGSPISDVYCTQFPACPVLIFIQ
jgi:hypothetical protein